MKRCSKCKEEKEFSEFYKDSRKKDGLKCWCKKCHLADNKERESDYNEYRKRYREENKEEYRRKKKIYYQEKKELILESNRNWRKTLNGKLMSYKRSAIQRNIIWSLSDEEFASFWNKNCNYCNDEIETIGIDRIDSSKGYSKDNVVPCCYQCNIAKMDYSEQEFLNKIKQIYELQRSRGRFD